MARRGRSRRSGGAVWGSRLADERRAMLAARERHRSWGAGGGGLFGTASPMFGSRAGGRPQPQIVVPARRGETIALAGEVEVPAGGGELEFQAILNLSGWRSESMPAAGPTSSVAAYYDVYVAVEPVDGAPMVDGQVRARADGVSLWGPVEDESWALPWVTAFSGTAHLPLTAAGTKFTVFADHGSGSARTLRCSLVARLVDTPMVIASDPPPDPPGGALSVSGGVLEVGNASVTLAVPEGTQVGDMMVAVAYHRQGGGQSSFGTIVQPSGWNEIDKFVFSGQDLEVVAWRRADAADAAGATHNWHIAGGSGIRKLGVLLCVYQTGFPASGNPFSTVERIVNVTGVGDLTVDTPSGGDFTLLVAGSQTNASFQTPGTGPRWVAPATPVAGPQPGAPDTRIPRLAQGLYVPDASATAHFINSSRRSVWAIAVDI